MRGASGAPFEEISPIHLCLETLFMGYCSLFKVQGYFLQSNEIRALILNLPSLLFLVLVPKEHTLLVWIPGLNDVLLSLQVGENVSKHSCCCQSFYTSW